MILDEIEKVFQQNQNSRIALFIRHAERDNGEYSLITKNGVATSEVFGAKIKKLNIPTKIYSSPELRCVQTAKIINNIASNMENEIILTNKLGNPGMQILDINKYQKLYAEFNFIYKDIYRKWKIGKYWDALRRPDDLKKIAESFIGSKTGKQGITLFVSQSGTMVNMAHSLNIAEYDENNQWIDYLDGFFIQL